MPRRHQARSNFVIPVVYLAAISTCTWLDEYVSDLRLAGDVQLTHQCAFVTFDMFVGCLLELSHCSLFSLQYVQSGVQNVLTNSGPMSCRTIFCITYKIIHPWINMCTICADFIFAMCLAIVSKLCCLVMITMPRFSLVVLGSGQSMPVVAGYKRRAGEESSSRWWCSSLVHLHEHWLQLWRIVYSPWLCASKWILGEASHTCFVYEKALLNLNYVPHEAFVGSTKWKKFLYWLIDKGISYTRSTPVKDECTA